MKICPQCHASCADTDTFCPKCGAPLAEEKNSAQQASQEQENPAMKDAAKENAGQTTEKRAEVISVTTQEQERQEYAEQERQEQGRQEWERQERTDSKGFFQMVKENLPNSKNWQQMYLSFEGRISRSQFFIRWLLVNIVAAVFVPLLAGVLPVYVVFFAISLFMQVSLCMRRFHDAGHGGIWVSVMLIPFVNIMAVIYLLFAKSEPRENEYGPQPQ
ncbi:MAG: DUF805 domain-containing protein [Acidaminococcus sp.]|jgi:uncharacterized membrane protein YhaH (DUF805 family)/predicted  nucleic acid-binding Zn-ribbon protein|nr:DUF805 domain-containing protein [Acidaminococcus sp.]MCI2100726.1 DUF805 domain-containing protein [Acidaminococcus sp.]MCI2115047.1 DUF805 domain-containing protein [Acidaminococcus sp.]MCI2117123.1 DUF805 domain-containing protein [Acidaminococcus sp.]